MTSGTEELYQGTAALRSSISSLHDGSQKMAEGTDSLYRETADSEAQIKEKIDDILQSINGSMEDPASFVSEKNTNVKSVQFVIKTDPVEINEKQPAEEKPKEESSLWKNSWICSNNSYKTELHIHHVRGFLYKMSGITDTALSIIYPVLSRL